MQRLQSMGNDLTICVMALNSHINKLHEITNKEQSLETLSERLETVHNLNDCIIESIDMLTLVAKRAESLERLMFPECDI